MKKAPVTHLHHLLNAGLTAALAFFLSAVPAFAQIGAGQTREWTGRCTNDGTATGVATIQGLECMLANILSVAIMFIGLSGFVMLIFSAFQYMISAGDSKKAEGAYKSVTFAVIGLIVALSAFIILNLISQFTGVDTILLFRIPNSDTGL